MPAPIDIRMNHRDSFVSESNSFSMSYTWSNSFRTESAFMEYVTPAPYRRKRGELYESDSSELFQTFFNVYIALKRLRVSDRMVFFTCNVCYGMT